MDTLKGKSPRGRRVATLVPLFALVSACTLYLGPGSSDSGGDTSGSTSPAAPLPAPSVWRVNPPVLNAEQQQRQQEVDQDLAKEYQAQGYRIRETIQTYNNDIVDWMEPSSVEGSQAEPPPPRGEAMQLPPGTQLQRTELDEHPELQGPDGTIPMLRPSYDAYVSGQSGATSLSDYLAHHGVLGAPASPAHLYAGMRIVADNQGAATWLTAFDGDIESKTFAVLEMIVGCPDGKGGMEWVGIAASKDLVHHDTAFNKFGGLLRVQVEYSIPDDMAPEGQGGGWEGLNKTRGAFTNVEGWKHAWPGIPIVPAPFGGPPVESYFVIQLFQPAVGTKQWWIGYNGFWLGYYDTSLFKKTEMSTKGCEVSWYGEVFDSTPTSWTSTDMGSGLYANTSFGNAAYFRDPYYTDLSGKSSWPDNAKYIAPFNDACYTRSPLYSGISPWDRWFFLGGPGGDAAYCK